MDPFRNCSVYYTPHSIDRIRQRNISSFDIRRIIREGKPVGEGNDVYKIRLGVWVVVVRLHKCKVEVRTAYRS